MPTIHTVAQGDTLTRIAREYKYGSAMALYNHPDNADFKALRPDPNIIFEGDEIVIPDILGKKIAVRSGRTHIFCVKKPREYFRLQVESLSGKALANTRIVVDMGGEKIDTMTDGNGMLEIEMTQGTECDAKLDVYTKPDSQEPDFTFKAKLTYLDPVEELSGVQARCNALGFDCGVADGIMGAKTRAGVKGFQAKHKLDVDGVPGPLTKAKLKEVYGS